MQCGANASSFLFISAAADADPGAAGAALPWVGGWRGGHLVGRCFGFLVRCGCAAHGPFCIIIIICLLYSMLTSGMTIRSL